MAKLSRFLKQSFNHWRGLTLENHLGSIFLSLPQKASDLMVQLLAFYRGKTLDTFLSQFPVKEFDTDAEYTWDVIGSARRNIPLIEARTSDGIIVNSTSPAMVGAGTEPFYLVFGEDWFADGRLVV